MAIEGIQHLVLELEIDLLSDVSIFDNTEVFILEAIHANRTGDAGDVTKLIRPSVASRIRIDKGAVDGITANIQVEERIHLRISPTTGNDERIYLVCC